jgi:NADPH-dependent 2,4-dienoyl-CoA reductase/sulfur reductase-like enzyme
VEDYRRLRSLADERQRFAVIGGGFIGSEIAAALAMNGKDVTLILSGEGIGDRAHPPEVSRFLKKYYEEQGVEVLTEQRVSGLESQDGQQVLKTESGREISADGIVAGIGIAVDTTLASEAGLTVEDGIVVDEYLRTSHPDIYASGDVAAFWDPMLGERRRVEHEDKEIVTDWTEPYKEGVVYYLRDGRVRGVLLWKVRHQLDAARRLIEEPGPFGAEDLKGRLPEAGAE